MRVGGDSAVRGTRLHDWTAVMEEMRPAVVHILELQMTGFTDDSETAKDGGTAWRLDHLEPSGIGGMNADPKNRQRA